MRKFFSFLITFILIGVLLFSGYNLEKKLNEYRIAKDISTKTSQENRKGREVNFDSLIKRNSDVKGWIYIKDTNIDYPIVQYSGEETRSDPFYIHRDIDKNYLYDGSIFIDSTVENPFKDFNTVIYGHRMLSGAMFHDITNFNDKEFFDTHPIVILETPEQSYDLHVVALLNENAHSKLYNTYFPEYLDELFSEEYEDLAGVENLISKEDFIALIKDKAINISDEPFDTNDCFVTLSTCKYSDSDVREQLICTVHEPTKNTKTEVIVQDNKNANIWFIAQIGVGIVIFLTIIALIPKPKRKKNYEKSN